MRDEKWEMRNERGMLYIYKKYMIIWKRGTYFGKEVRHAYCSNDASFVVPSFLLFSTMHCNLASYEVLSWFLSLPWDYKTYTAKVLILICKVEEFVAGIEILETLRLVYAIQYPYNPDTRVGEGNLTKFLTLDCHIVKVLIFPLY